LFQLAEQLERAPEEALVPLRHSLAAFREEQRAAEERMMSNDKKLISSLRRLRLLPETPILNHVLLHGRYWLHRTVPREKSAGANECEDPRSREGFRRASGEQRLRAAMESMGPCPADLMQMFETRVIPVCGDLGQRELG